jgi:hypothetical protein
MRRLQYQMTVLARQTTPPTGVSLVTPRRDIRNSYCLSKEASGAMLATPAQGNMKLA